MNAEYFDPKNENNFRRCHPFHDEQKHWGLSGLIVVAGLPFCDINFENSFPTWVKFIQPQLSL
jgi:hypothetical protein